MNSFKTIKLAILTGLMASTVAPMHANYLEKTASFLAAALVPPAVGAFLGSALGMSFNSNKLRIEEQQTISEILTALRDRDAYIYITIDIDQLKNVSREHKNELRNKIDAYHKTLQLVGSNQKKIDARAALIAVLTDIELAARGLIISPRGHKPVLNFCDLVREIKRKNKLVIGGGIVGALLGAVCSYNMHLSKTI